MATIGKRACVAPASALVAAWVLGLGACARVNPGQAPPGDAGQDHQTAAADVRFDVASDNDVDGRGGRDGDAGDGASEGGAANDGAASDGGVGDGDGAADRGDLADGGSDSGPLVARFPRLFADDFAPGVSFAGFAGATNTVAIDPTVAHTGVASWRVEIGSTGYTGGALHSAGPLDLSPYSAVTFWAKASAPKTLNVVGLGNNAASATYGAEWTAVPLTTDWRWYVVPIPLPDKLTAETGLFHFAEGSDEGAYTIWFDDIQYETLDASVLGPAQPVIATVTVNRQVGDSFTVDGTTATFAVSGANQTIAAARPYFTFASSDPTIATVDATGTVLAVGAGTATISARLGTTDAAGAITLTVAPVSMPATAAPAPTGAAADVIALLSAVYTDRAVDTWSAVWDSADVADVDVAGVATKLYSNLAFAGVEFFAPPDGPIDATEMIAFHLDVWTPTATMLGVKLVDFGADGAFGGGDDSEAQITFDATTTPALLTQAWLSLDIPLASFTTLAARGHLAQLVLVADAGSTLFVENVYFHR